MLFNYLWIYLYLLPPTNIWGYIFLNIRNFWNMFYWLPGLKQSIFQESYYIPNINVNINKLRTWIRTLFITWYHGDRSFLEKNCRSKPSSPLLLYGHVLTSFTPTLLIQCFNSRISSCLSADRENRYSIILRECSVFCTWNVSFRWS